MPVGPAVKIHFLGNKFVLTGSFSSYTALHVTLFNKAAITLISMVCIIIIFVSLDHYWSV